jgi:predicted nucleotidyltransferase
LKTTGIIAEYNPLHWGHVYHIRKSRERAQADSIIAVISSNFVQRGEPSFVDKRTRTEMALACGVDLALELPAVFSSRSAGVFANAAVDILAATGLTDCISFGMETPLEGGALFPEIAGILNDEPDGFRNDLKKFLDDGYSFVQARGMALERQIPGSLELLRQPNNNLALAYIKRIRERNLPMTPIAIERMGGGFHETEAKPGEFASASAIREIARDLGVGEAREFMPESSLRSAERAIAGGHAALDRDRLWRAIKQALLRATPHDLSLIAEMREGVENRMIRAAYSAPSYDSFLEQCTSRRYPRGRIQRYCIHLLLNLRKAESLLFQANGPAYIKVLGANARGRLLRARMRRTAELPVISRSAGALGPYADKIIQFEHASAEIWETLTENPRPRSESRMTPVIIP